MKTKHDVDYTMESLYKNSDKNTKSNIDEPSLNHKMGN